MLITHSVEEAIYLASRIVVVTARPARIKEIIDVPFAYPRDESIQERPEFGELRSYIRRTRDERVPRPAGADAPRFILGITRQNGGNIMDRRQFLTTTAGLALGTFARLRHLRSRRPRPRCASAICTPSPSTARSGPAWTAARSTSRASISSCGSSTPAWRSSRR